VIFNRNLDQNYTQNGYFLEKIYTNRRSGAPQPPLSSVAEALPQTFHKLTVLALKQVIVYQKEQNASMFHFKLRCFCWWGATPGRRVP